MASSFTKKLFSKNLIAPNHFLKQRRSESANTRNSDQKPEDAIEIKLKSVITQQPRANKNTSSRKPSLDSLYARAQPFSLNSKKETPVASHNYFSNYTRAQKKSTTTTSDSRPQTAQLGRKKSVPQIDKDLAKALPPPQQQEYLIPPKKECHYGKKTLVLDLDETLVHSQFKAIDKPDIVLPIQIEGQVYDVYVLKRPGLEQFLRRMAPLYEIVVFTASLSKYADPLLNIIDKYGYCTYRLFREHCTFNRGSFVKDLVRLGRNMNEIMIVDNAPASYMFQPENAYPCISWYDDMKDRELYDMIPIMEALATVDDLRVYLQAITAQDRVLYSQAMILINKERRREKERKLQRLEEEAQAAQGEVHKVAESGPARRGSWFDETEQEQPPPGYGIIHSMPQGVANEKSGVDIRRGSAHTSSTTAKSVAESVAASIRRPQTAGGNSQRAAIRGGSARVASEMAATERGESLQGESRKQGGAVVKKPATTANQPRDFSKKKNSVSSGIDFRSSFTAAYPGQISSKQTKTITHSSSTPTLQSAKVKPKYKAMAPSTILNQHPHYKNPSYVKMPRSGSISEFSLRKGSQQDDSATHSNLQTNQGDQAESRQQQFTSDPQSKGDSRRTTPKPTLSPYAHTHMMQFHHDFGIDKMTASPVGRAEYVHQQQQFTTERAAKRPTGTYMQNTPKYHVTQFGRFTAKKSGAKTPKQTMPLKKPPEAQLRSSDFMRPYQEALYQKLVERRSAGGYYMQNAAASPTHQQYLQSYKDAEILAEGARTKMEASGSFKSKTQPLSIRDCLRDKTGGGGGWV